MEINIRQATQNDLEQLIKLSDVFSRQECRLHDPFIDRDWAVDKRGIQYLQEHIQDDDKLELVAEIDGKIVGYLTAQLDEGLEYRVPMLNAVLDNIFIDKDYRSQGIGGKFMEKFLEWCKSKQAKLISVTPYFKNEQAINFYKKHGFAERDIVLERKLD